MRKLMMVSLASFGIVLLAFGLVRDEPTMGGQPQQSRGIASTDHGSPHSSGRRTFGRKIPSR